MSSQIIMVQSHFMLQFSVLVLLMVYA